MATTKRPRRPTVPRRTPAPRRRHRRRWRTSRQAAGRRPGQTREDADAIEASCSRAATSTPRSFFPTSRRSPVRLARRLPAHVEIDDLILGVIRLMEAAERFDPSRVDRFEAFAESRIRGAPSWTTCARATPCRDMRVCSTSCETPRAALRRSCGRTPDQEESPAAPASVSTSCTHASRSCSGHPSLASTMRGPTLWNAPVSHRRRPFRAGLEARDDRAAGFRDRPSAREMQQVCPAIYCDNLNLKEIGAVLGRDRVARLPDPRRGHPPPA